MREFDPYGTGNTSGGSDSGSTNDGPYPRHPETIGSTIAEQLEVQRRALNYRSRFENEVPTSGPSSPGDVNRGGV